jgi:lipoprotein-anchoring transpeptidase ErfK/SrfK
MTSLHLKLLKALAATKFALAALVLLAGGAQARGTVGPEQGRIHVEINKGSQQMIVHVDGERRMTFRVSTGKSGHATPSGTFRALVMKEMHYSRKYDNAPMPHAIFFTNAGHAIHATNAVRNLGRPASHGCVRLSPRDARALYDLVERLGMKSVTIRIS